MQLSSVKWKYHNYADFNSPPSEGWYEVPGWLGCVSGRAVATSQLPPRPAGTPPWRGIKTDVVGMLYKKGVWNV